MKAPTRIAAPRRWNEESFGRGVVLPQDFSIRGDHPSSSSIRWPLGIGLLLLLAILTAIGFGMTALHPLSWTKPVHLLWIESIDARGIASPIDDPENCSVAFAHWPIRSSEDATVEVRQVDPSVATAEAFADQLVGSDSTRPLVVRLAGVLDASQGHANLWPISGERTTHPINCSRIADRLCGRQGPTLLFIEARHPAELSMDQYPEEDAWHFQQALRQQMDGPNADGRANSRLAVVVDFDALQSTLTDTAAGRSTPQDHNANGLWECSEWLADLTRSAPMTRSVSSPDVEDAITPDGTGSPKTAPKTIARRFVMTPAGNDRWDFPIAPMATIEQLDSTPTLRQVGHGAVEPATMKTETIAKDDRLIDSRDSFSTNDGATADVLASSMALAVWSHATPWPTHDAEVAVPLSNSWRVAINDPSSDKAIRKWLTDNAEATGHWRETRSAVTLIDQPLSWSARRDLLLCVGELEMLMADPLMHRTFQARGKKLRQRWNDLMRRGMFHETKETIPTPSIDPAECRRLRLDCEAMRADCNVLRQAEQVVESINAKAAHWVNLPIPARPHPASTSVLDRDPGCQLLAAAIRLQRVLCRSQLDTSREVTDGLSELQHHLAASGSIATASGRWETIDVSWITACRRERYRLSSELKSLTPIVRPETKVSVAQCLHRIANEWAGELKGAGMTEQVEGRKTLDQLQIWIERLGSPARIASPRSFVLTCDGQDRLIDQSDATLSVTVRATDGQPVQGTWTFDTDESIWQLATVHGDPALSDASLTIQLHLQKRAMPTSPQWLRCSFVTESDGCSINVPLPTAAAPFASVRWEFAQPSQLFPNSINPIELQIQSLDRSFKRASVRWLARKTTTSFPETIDAPEGVWSGAAVAKVQWDDVVSTVLADADPIICSPDRPTTVTFSPSAVDPKMPTIDAQWLRLEIRDLDSPRLQCINVRPAIGRPAVWLQPKVDFDHRAAKVSIAPRWRRGDDLDQASDSAPPLRRGSILHARLVDPDRHHHVAHASVACEGDRWPTLTLSTRMTDRPVDLVLDTLGWRNAFRYRIDPNVSLQDVPISSHVSGITWDDNHESSRDAIPTEPSIETFGTADQTTSVSVHVGVNDGEFDYGQDEITVGIDRNRNRYLEEDEIVATANTPVRTEFVWAGVNEQGHVCVGNLATNQRFEIPLTPHKNQRIDLLAEFRRGVNVWRTEPRTIIVDHQRPTIARAVPAHGGPYQQSLPITLTIDADDKDLTGIQRVEAAWANDGNISFSADTKAVPAGRQSDGRWTVELPTDDRPLGLAVAMIRAFDLVHNASEIQTVAIDLQSAAEVEAFGNRPTSTIAGRVLYVTEPVANLLVQFQRQSESDSQTIVAPIEVVTDSTGRFLSPKLSPGKYQVTVSGLYRGVRRRETIDATVPAHQLTQTPDILIR